DDDARCEGIPRIHSGPRHHDLAARARRTMALRGGYLERSASPRRAEMTMRKSMATSAAVGILSIALLATGAAAAEIKVLSAVAMKAAIDDLAREFERGTGHAIKVDYATAGQVRDRIRDGEAFDVAIMPASAFDPLVAQGRIAAPSATVVARSLVAIAVPAGAPRPDISTVDAVKRSLLAAKSVVYPDPAKGRATGIHAARVIERLGIAA